VPDVPKRQRSPRRQEYEAAFPTVSARIPAEVKEKLAQMLRAEDLNLSEWVLARVADSAPQLAAAYERGRIEGRQEGEASGYARGVQVAGTAGFRAGLLASLFAAENGRSYNATTIAQRLLEHPEQRRIAEGLLPEAYRPALATLLRAAERARARASG
jgi:flagellar biosynthesis/type III secretory pathway protein FliH